jgi:lactate dehydrogenase-like 2-hydroxyacid dehydrogenase
MPKPTAFVTRALPEKGMRLVEDFCDAQVWAYEIPPSRDELLRGVRGRDGLLALLTDTIDAELMDAAPNLKVISNCAVGVDNIEVAAATSRGIPVGNTPDVLTDATADMAFALLLAAARRIVEGVDYVKAGKWRTWNLQLLLGADLAGRTLGIVGLGRIGRAVATRAQGFGLRVVYHDPSASEAEMGRSVSFEELLRTADFVSLHVPLTPATRHMINARAIGLMRRTAILINTSRGPVVDHSALYDALKSGRIAGAGLDVTEPEPINPDNPLLKLENCLILPHLGSASRWTREQMAVLAAENLIAGLQGKRLPHCVNPEVYDQA